MSIILRRLPFREVEDEVHVGLGRILIRPYQIIMWVSVTARTVLDLPPGAPRVPALLDTGYNHNFSIQDRQLTNWAGVASATLPRLSRIDERGRWAPLHAAHVWIQPNVPGKRDEFSDAPAFRLSLDQGIALYPSDANFPRLPLLGLRALARNRLYLSVDAEHRAVTLRTPDWRTKFLRLTQ